MRPNQAFHALETLVNSSPTSLRRKGTVLSDSDNQTVVEVYQQWILLMMDLGYLPPDELKRQGRRLLNDMFRVDVLDLNNSFAECLSLIRTQTRRGFKALCGKISSHLYTMVKDDFDASLLGDVYAAGRLVQLFSYTSRLSLRDLDLTQQLLEQYLAVEESLPLNFDEKITRVLNFIVKRWFGSFVPFEIVPQHGPGGVARLGRCSLQEKYLHLASDQRLVYAFPDNFGLLYPNTRLIRESETIFVPKSYKTFRTISMEPPTLQFYQQGIWHSIEKQVRCSKYLDSRFGFCKNRPKQSYLENRIGFRHQERNRLLAKEGSISRNYATLDLSAASDSVSHELVKRVFRGTWLLRYLVATRSTHTHLPDGRSIQLKKFAPMGSALCFPIETIIFAACCEYVTRDCGVPGNYSVYGDDIIVPTHCVEKMIDLLTTLGFTVNREKSFYQPTCWFRESCGGEYVDGFDITPMRVSRTYNHSEQDVGLDALISLSNEAYKRNYRNLRYFFLMKLRRMGVTPYFAPESLLGDSYTNYHTKTRWNVRLQRLEVRVSTTRTFYSKVDVLHQDEEIRYRHWLLTNYNRQSVEEASVSCIARPFTAVVNTWKEKPYQDSDQILIDSFRPRVNSVSS